MIPNWKEDVTGRDLDKIRAVDNTRGVHVNEYLYSDGDWGPEILEDLYMSFETLFPGMNRT
jgi:hypothetical protein